MLIKKGQHQVTSCFHLAYWLLSHLTTVQPNAHSGVPRGTKNIKTWVDVWLTMKAGGEGKGKKGENALKKKVTLLSLSTGLQ